MNRLNLTTACGRDPRAVRCGNMSTCIRCEQNPALVEPARPAKYEPTADEWIAVGASAYRENIRALLAKAEAAAEARSAEELAKLRESNKALAEELRRTHDQMIAQRAETETLRKLGTFTVGVDMAAEPSKTAVVIVNENPSTAPGFPPCPTCGRTDIVKVYEKRPRWDQYAWSIYCRCGEAGVYGFTHEADAISIWEELSQRRRAVALPSEARAQKHAVFHFLQAAIDCESFDRTLAGKLEGETWHVHPADGRNSRNYATERRLQAWWFLRKFRNIPEQVIKAAATQVGNMTYREKFDSLMRLTAELGNQ